MTATILRFPIRDVRVEREAGDLGWFVLLPDRSFSWLHGSYSGAFEDACKVAADLGVAVVSSAGRCAP
jgi:hypothetical protein